jgi:hypothetical protein
MCMFAALFAASLTGAVAQPPVVLGQLSCGAKVLAVQDANQGWGLCVEEAGLACAVQPQPAAVEIWNEESHDIVRQAAAYDSVATQDGALVGKARLVYREVAIDLTDRWIIDGAILRVARTVRVTGHASGGFLSEVALRLAASTVAWPDVQWFAPGMVYGGFDNLTGNAIGGRAYYQPGRYVVRIREDRLPAPLLAAYFADGTTLTVLDPAPCGRTTAAESVTVQPGTLIDSRFRFGSVGAQEGDAGLSLGYWFPGTEGEQTYQGNTYPDGQLHEWRRRYHPLSDGHVQQYEVAFRFGREDDFSKSMASAWRWAWQALHPQVNPHDIELTRRVVVDALASNVVEVADRAGIPNAVPAVSDDHAAPCAWTVMGFTGKAIEAAEFMLAESLLDNTERGTQLRRQAERIIASFLRLRMAPPEAEGFFIETGQPTTALAHLPHHPEIYLRSFGDDVKALLRAYERERRHNRDHPEWLAWAQQFADWLLTQQQPKGGFPRAWLPKEGTVYSASPNSTYNAIPLLILLYRHTGHANYLDAAVRAGEFCWANGQAEGRFIGGTIDNPDVLDKEAGTLSLEAYLLLHEATGEPQWLDRAKAAANYAETWIYLWDVPMPEDADDHSLHWKCGVPTVGLQLIATGHSLVDAFMSFDVDEYAKLYQLTGDEHYRDVARILLHNTKGMVAFPNRSYDLRGPGWQQEHFSLAPPRGYGLHRLWLPWVATSQLNGIFGLMELDSQLFQQLADRASSSR